MAASQSVKSICCYCGTGCGVVVRRDARGALTLHGDESHPTNRGMLCSKGKALLHAALARGERLTQPQVRLDRARPFERSGWDAAMAHVAAQIQRIRAEHGPDAVAFYASGQMLTEEYYVLNKLVKGFLGTNNLDTNSRLCMSSAVAGYKRTLGADSPPIAYEDLEQADTFLVAGANPAWAHPILWRRVEARRAADPEARIIVVDPRRTATCANADLHLQIMPGTDVALHLALARRLRDIEGIDRDFIDAHTEGWDDFERSFERFTLERAAEICRVPAADIARAAEWLAGDRRFLSLWTMGLNQSAVGVDKNVTLIALSLITGKIGRPGCGPFSLTGQPNAMGGREVGGMATLASAHRELSDPAHRAEIAAHWRVPSVPEKPGLTAVELFRAAREGRVKAIWIVATNPVESLPEARAVEEALAAAELVVVQDIYPTATAAHAHVLLPAATWLEKTGTMTSSERRVSLLDPLLEPPGQALPDSRIFMRFAQAMGWGASFGWRGEAEIFAEHAALTRGRDCDLGGLTHERLRRDGGLQWPVPSPEHPGTPRLFGDHRFATPSGRARLWGAEVDDRSDPLTPDSPLVLTTGRLRDQWHTMTRTGKVAKLREHAPAPSCEIHPRDADARGIRGGDIVLVGNQRGEVQVRAEISDAIKEGVVFLPMHWGKASAGERGRTNALTSPRLDPVSKEPDLKFAAVQVRRYAPPRRRIVIVGGGAATRAFIEAHRGNGSEDELAVFGEEPEPIYNRVLLPHLIARDTDFTRMITATPSALAAQRVEFHPGTRIARLDRAGKAVIDASGERHGYDLLVLATGSRPAKHYQGPMPRGGVHGLRRRADAEAIRAEAGPGRRAIIVGAGLLGLELADALARIGTDVAVLQRSDRLMGKQLDAKASAYLAEAMAAAGVRIRFNADVEELIGEERIVGTRLKDGTTLPCDLLVFATGTVANAELARSAVLQCSNGVVVDEHLRTSDPSIHAIGEVAEFRGLGVATTAAAEVQARHLAEFLRGNLHAPYRGPVNANILKVHGVRLASVGLAEAGPGMQELTLDDPALGVYQKCVIKDDRLVGVIMLGDTDRFEEHRELVASGVELDERRRALLRSGESRPVDGRLVCSCNQVGEGTITRAIGELADAGRCELREVCAATRAGTSCGSCRPEVAQLIARGLPKPEPVRDFSPATACTTAP
jgi:ferredoxin-nitrate reductase